ncbi:MAG TPA: mechanosensitive ion channel [Anaerolineae bacterium]
MTVPLFDQVSQFLPRLVTAVLLIILAFIIAVIVRAVLRRVVTALRLDERMRSGQAGGTSAGGSLANLIGQVGFWLVILLFLPAILSALEIGGLLLPFQNMVDKLLGFLPNLLAAIVILVVGFFVARLVRQIVTALLARAGVDGLGARVGFTAANRQQPLSNLLGLVVYVLIIIPVITAAVNALGLPSLTTPLTDMLTTMLNALPNIFAAVLLLVLSYVIARLVATLVTGLLKGIGFDNILTRIGFSHQPRPDARSPSDVVGYLVLVGIMFFAAIEASRLLGFAEVATLIAGVTVLLGQIVLGLIIFGIGLFLANLAFQAINDTGMQQATWLAWAARFAILILTGAMALRQMGLAPEIINLAFGLLLGAVAVAAALAFGLGGQQVASRLLDDSVRNIRTSENRTLPPTELPPGSTPAAPHFPPGPLG